MKKRIRVHQVQIGMYVEELEIPVGQMNTTFKRPLLLTSDAEVKKVMKSNAFSVVINTHRGIDVGQSILPPRTFDMQTIRAELLAPFTQAEIVEAEECIATALPHVRSIIIEARICGTFRMQLADAAVEHIMSAAMNTDAALLTITRLKNRDETTYLHSLAVSALMIAFGRKLRLGEDSIRLLGIGGLVHDIGKSAISPKILNKAGKLTADEMATMKTHAQVGYDMLKQLDSIPPVVLDICLYHHERYDGTGYPHGLKGTDIPFAARLAAVCDVYDALTTVRPYKHAWSQTEATDLMLRSPGHFDPDLLDAFILKLSS